MIEGTLDLSQFWPIGESDADTTKIVLTILPGAVQYQPAGDVPRPTTKFDGACVRSVGQLKPVIKNGRITVRLQGLDAPELHYQPQSMKRKTYKGKPFGSLKGSGLVKKYRQHQAETATVRLGRYLSTFGTSPLPCRFQTEVNDHEGPADAVDKYGRFVGNVLVNEIDINLKILRQGLAIVALYNSMHPAEMDACLEAWAIGKTATDGVAQYQTRMIGEFDPQLLYQKPATASYRKRPKSLFTPSFTVANVPGGPIANLAHSKAASIPISACSPMASSMSDPACVTKDSWLQPRSNSTKW